MTYRGENPKTTWPHKLAIVGPDDRPTLAREQMEAMRNISKEFDNLCNLALEALELRAENEKLQRERDEALARCHAALSLLPDGVMIAEVREAKAKIDADKAEARAKALEEAAAVVTDASAIVDHPSVYMGGPSRQAKWVAEQFAAAILALKEKP